MTLVKIQLDTPHSHYTNFDFVQGRVVLSLIAPEAITAIVVKLEGESKTRLASPRLQDNRRDNRTELEIHKLLYKVKEVFPSKEIKASAQSGSAFTLSPGQHEYPFTFKIPINNNCVTSNSLYSNLNFTGLRMEMAKDSHQHVKKTLPPSLRGFPGEAEIRYYIKVTVQRFGFFKENYRDELDFTFFPIELPRKPDTGQETYARRQHQFTAGLPPGPKSGINSLFGDLRKTSSSNLATEATGIPPRFSIDARLPNPPILTCHKTLPLRIIVSKQSECSDKIFLKHLQVELIGYTHVRAHDLTRSETTSWIICSLSNLSVPLGEPTDPVGKDMLIDSKYWDQVPLPSSVAPSFETCNISRRYELEARVGLSYGKSGKSQPQPIVLPLRLAVEVYSGIPPPRQLLENMAAATSKPVYNQAPPANAAYPVTPTAPSYSSVPPAQGSFGGPTLDPSQSMDAPPSYEDAIAEDIGPVDGPRREYNNSAATANPTRSGEKDSTQGDRLFPNSTGTTNPGGSRNSAEYGSHIP